MSSKFKFFSVLTLAAIVAVGSTAVFAQEDKTTPPPAVDKADKAGKFGKRGRMGRHGFGKFGRFGGFGRHRGGMGFMESLNLTDAQKAQLKSIREANKPDAALMEELRAIRESRKAGQDITAEQRARLHAIHDQMRVKRQQVHDQIQNVFTAEQKALIEQRKLEMKTRMEQFKQNRELRRKQKVDATPAEKPAV